MSTTVPPTSSTAVSPGSVGGRFVLPTSPNTLHLASVSQETTTERRWSLTLILLIFGGGAVATARIRRKSR